jgi:RNA polymerase sigma-70 factor (ECF subfamily)
MPELRHIGGMFEPSSHSDLRAVEAVSAPDACPDWDAAFELYYAELCEYTLRLIGSAEVAQDVVQDLFLELWDTRGPRDAIRLAKPYLYVAARNRALKYLRRRRVAQAWIERAAREEPPSSESPSDLYLRHELEEAIDRAIAELPMRCREIFLLRRRDQLSYEEIATRAGVSLGTVKSQMWRAATMLREKLTPYLAGALSLVAHVNIDSVLH